MIRAIVIDDEKMGLESLTGSLERYCPEVSLVGTTQDPEEGVNLINLHKPDLVFLDIQMPKLSGFDVLNQVDKTDFEVIFVTSYDKYAIKAIRFSALDYLLKPIEIDDLVQAVRRAGTNITLKTGADQRYASVLHNVRQHYSIERLAIPSLDGIDFFETRDIIFMQASGSYTTIFLIGNRNHVVSKNLKDFELMLGTQRFCRVHHSFLINLHHVIKYVKGEGGYVILNENHEVDISRRRKDFFMNMLDKI